MTDCTKNRHDNDEFWSEERFSKKPAGQQPVNWVDNDEEKERADDDIASPTFGYVFAWVRYQPGPHDYFFKQGRGKKGANKDGPPDGGFGVGGFIEPPIHSGQEIGGNRYN